MSEDYGFNPKRVFGNGVGNKPFNLSDGGGMFDPLSLGENYGEKIGREAGLANGEMSFLRQIGRQERGIPSILPTSRPRGRPATGRRRTQRVSVRQGGGGYGGYDIRNIDVLQGFEGLGAGFERSTTKFRKALPKDIKVVRQKNIVTQVVRQRKYRKLIKRQRQAEPHEIAIRQARRTEKIQTQRQEQQSREIARRAKETEKEQQKQTAEDYRARQQERRESKGELELARKALRLKQEEEREADRRERREDQQRRSSRGRGGQGYEGVPKEAFEARYGFHGIVNKPTLFLAGEAGSERVNIRPIKGNKMSRSRNNSRNIFDWRNFDRGFKF